jgi:hypothetical protein
MDGLIHKFTIKSEMQSKIEQDFLRRIPNLQDTTLLIFFKCLGQN